MPVFQSTGDASEKKRAMNLSSELKKLSQPDEGDPI